MNVSAKSIILEILSVAPLIHGPSVPVRILVKAADVFEVAENSVLPERTQLKGNYPNPFNPTTVIRYAMPVGGRVQLDVYNLLGQHQQRLTAGLRPAGFHEVRFDGASLSSGVYFYRLLVIDKSGKPLFNATHKMMLMK